MRPKTCKVCKTKFQPVKPLQVVCGLECAIEQGNMTKARQEAKNALAERKQTREKLDKLKTKAQWTKEAQAAFNAYIRERDKEMPCICCGRLESKVSGLGSHGWDCGHFRSTGSAPHLRFNEDNAHRQLVFCNRWRGGNAVDYRIGLIARIGLERVEALEADNEPKKYTIDDLKAIKHKYKRMLADLKENA